MNISYIKEDMIDFMDSPVPYLIGMSDSLWDKIGSTKWAECCRSNDDVVIVRLDGEMPYLMIAEGSETEALI